MTDCRKARKRMRLKNSCSVVYSKPQNSVWIKSYAVSTVGYCLSFLSLPLNSILFFVGPPQKSVNLTLIPSTSSFRPHHRPVLFMNVRMLRTFLPDLQNCLCPIYSTPLDVIYVPYETIQTVSQSLKIYPTLETA